MFDVLSIIHSVRNLCSEALSASGPNIQIETYEGKWLRVNGEVVLHTNMTRHTSDHGNTVLKGVHSVQALY